MVIIVLGYSNRLKHAMLRLDVKILGLGLVGFASAAPKHPARTDAAIEAQIVALRTAHPTWGKRRIADELAKGNAWQRVVSPNTVARILRDHALWTATAKKNDPSDP